MVDWYSESSPLERRTFWASFGGWALDALDVQMFPLRSGPDRGLPYHKAEAGLLGSVTLFFGAIGGLGRRRARRSLWPRKSVADHDRDLCAGDFRLRLCHDL